MRVTVLGKSPSWQDAGGACSGYLIETGDFTLLLDCGNGVFAKLRSLVDYLTVDAVLITHLHADHLLDLFPFSYALTIAPHAKSAPRQSRPRLHALPGAGEFFRSVAGSWGASTLVDSAFEVHEYDGERELSIGPLTARLCEVPHFTRTFAVDLASADSGRLTFSADCAPNQSLAELARDTDLLLIEATLDEPEADGPRGHLTPLEAGEHGRRAGARRLVVTHFSDQLDPDWVERQAATGFGAAVTLAHEGAVYTV